jgi:CDP-glycerol glycerophosphotransferase (TagB/SpsB family)
MDLIGAGRSRLGLGPRLKGLASRVGGAMHPADRSRLQRIFRGRAKYLGRVSVIVPVFNVEPYLADCLASIVAQDYPFLEIIVVDDGSSDGSRAIMDDFALRDRRFLILDVPHGGNGRARNAGLERATGKYIAFADSDDIVAPGAYGAMITKLHSSSSEFVVGSSDRLVGRKRTSVHMMEKLHAIPRTGISLTDYPEIISDVFFWNKMFRKDFWDSAVATIPQDVLYEDQETTARAYARATAFDIIPDVVYSWRFRQDGTSITQGKHSIRDLRDRLGVVEAVSRLLLAERGPDVLMPWFTRVLGSDLVPYFEQVPQADEEYWCTLHGGVSQILATVQSVGMEFATAMLRNIGPHEQILGSLAALGARADVEGVLIHRFENGTGFETQIRNNRFFARLEYLQQLATSYPDDLLEFPASALTPVFQISSRGWSHDGALEVGGHFYLPGLDSAAYPGEITVQLKDDSGHLRDGDVERAEDPYVDTLSTDPYARHSAAAFTCRIASDLLPAGGTIELAVTLAVAQEVYERRHVLTLPSRSSGGVVAGSAARRPTVTDVAFDHVRKQFSICVTIPRSPTPGSPSLDLALVTARSTVRPISVEENGPDFRIFRFPLTQVTWGREVAAPFPGAYTLRYASGGEAISQSSLPVQVDDSLASQLPLEQGFPSATVTVFRAQSGVCAVGIAPPLGSGERGKYNQRLLREEYARPAGPPALTDGVLFESFSGKSCTDSPRALSDALHAESADVPIYWSINDFSVEYPTYAIPVLRGSREWFARLKTSKTVVNNNNFPFYFRKSEGQRYVQTWHGTPLKKLARHAPNRYLSASYRRTMEREAQMWDLILAQNDFASEVLPAAFGYTGAVLTVGYPRNDALVRPDRESRAERVRQTLGIETGKIVVLYAPTWRDDARDGSQRHKLVSHLDFAVARKTLGSNYVFLMRGHHNVAGNSSTRVGSNVIDVSMYPEINDLILVSDLLVTDYSSITFDYCVTDKPMFFLVPDLGQYRDETRGFYLDWELTAPGPLCVDTEELCEAISGAGTRSEEDVYRRFKASYAAMDDGGATDRVVEAIWPLVGAPAQ